jgi:hypothetical protein
LDEPGEYVPEPYDMVIFDRPPEGSRNRLFHVASHDADTGLTTFTELPDPLSAGQIAELGGRKALWAKFVPEPGDMVRFDRPPDGSLRAPDGSPLRLFQVASHDADTGLTTFTGLPDPLSAGQIAELGGSKLWRPDDPKRKVDWTHMARKLAREGAGSRTKIRHAFQPIRFVRGGHMVRDADEQAALALAQRAADDRREPVIVARLRSGELMIGNALAFEEMGEAFGAETTVVAQPGAAEGDSRFTARQVRELLTSLPAKEAITTALTYGLDLPDPVVEARVNDITRALTGLLASEQEPNLPPGWRYHEELMPEIAERLARIRSEEETEAG